MAERREALTPDERARLSTAAVRRLLALPEFGAARVIGGFVATRSEIDPAAALVAAQGRGATVLLPRVGQGVPRLRFHQVVAADDLRLGRYGILEPVASCPEMPAEDIDLFLVPGLAFDRQGRRLGYGGGYYDELGAYLRASGRGMLVGFGYDFQLVESCPVEEGDVAIDCLVTDGRVVRCHEITPH